ncbi:hypothetical protein K0504_08505 [Neiella marina]|uniref:Uncharacterized protein n=1 Tax=Neiella holothuriorum TaxID=2870530 RepID=A0ABS7EFE0_9GAMM|nr:hypothetical protein [Neiella holothuriorum]MBW8191072.1 hypothetical protein [Neiella holothuriorum]
MKRIQIAVIAGLTLASTAFVPAASANELTTAITDVALNVAEQVASDVKESSVRQIDEMWASLQSMMTEEAADE